jgi:hypothetical protein
VPPMARKSLVALLLGIWIGLFAIELASGFAVAANVNIDKRFTGNLNTFGPAILESEDADEVEPIYLAAFCNSDPSKGTSQQVGLKDKESPSTRASEIYKLCCAFLL